MLISSKKTYLCFMNKVDINTKLQELIACQSENEVVEFKEAKDNFDFSKLGQYFSALSNEANLHEVTCAWLVFGIKDKGHTIVGSRYRIGQNALNSLKKEIADKTTDRITFIEIYEQKLPEGRVVLFQIPPAPKGVPIAFEGHYYGRDWESLVPLNIEEMERIRRQVKINDWSAMLTEATLDDLDAAAIQKAKDNFAVKNPRIVEEIKTWDAKTFLSKAQLSINGKITNTAILLLGKPEASIYLKPVVPQITWVLYTKEKVERDYYHFRPPYILAVDEVLARIRNIKYRYLKDGTLFPEEVDQYNVQNIKEALSNCIAHMDYALGGRIGVAENEDGYLSFVNPGSFLPGNIEQVIHSEEPPTIYRNPLLASIMESINMIDSIGSGIKRMFLVQSERYFPLPDYELENNKVKMTLTGKILNMDYARLLAKSKELSLDDIILLDKIQKKKTISKEEEKNLKNKKLIEGRSPNYFIGVSVAQEIGQKAEYSKNKAFEKTYYVDLILKALKEHGSLSRGDIDKLLWKKLPDWMSDEQRKIKIANLISELRREGKIENKGGIRTSIWMLKNYLIIMR